VKIRAMTTIRPARLPDDKPALLSFIDGLQAFEHAFEPNRRRDAAVAEDYFAKLAADLAARPGAIFVAEDKGCAIGWAVVHETQDDIYVIETERRIAYIAELFVTERSRGKGTGRALIAACEDWAKGRGIPVMLIGVLPGNARAKAIYEAAGYGAYAIQLRKTLR
jgi:GNAT superfamily N-acetyltransferase